MRYSDSSLCSPQFFRGKLRKLEVYLEYDERNVCETPLRHSSGILLLRQDFGRTSHRIPRTEF